MLFRVWGNRGGRNTQGSRIGNSTSCYSLNVGEHLYVFDAGRGLLALADALVSDERLRSITHVHLLITHAHLDHWEGLKDASWMWRAKNDLHLSLLGPKEALDTISSSLQPPGFVPLETLAIGTLASLSRTVLEAGSRVALPGASLDVVALHHYSGAAPHQRYLDTLGYRLVVDGGPEVAYVSDHEPTDDTRGAEDALVGAAQLAVIDANCSDIVEHDFGHGSIEYAAGLARRHPDTLVLAGHHGPLRSDDTIEQALARHGAGTANLALAVEGDALRWDAQARRFVR